MRHPVTRPQMRRMMSIDQMLRVGKWPTKKELATKLEVSDRTITRDIEFMRLEQNAPIEFDRRRAGYHYREETYHVPSAVGDVVGHRLRSPCVPGGARANQVRAARDAG